MKVGQQTILAKKLSVSNALISRLLNGNRPVSNEMARRLSELFPETTPGFWIDADLITLKRMFAEWEPRPEMR